MRAPVRATIALGANLGDSAHTLRAAVSAMAALPLTQLVRASSLYRSAPVAASGPDFINAVALIDTQLSAPQLLAQLQAIEQDFGRQRSTRNAPRTLDLDLLLYGSAQIYSPALTVPHPRMYQRAFVLLPLAEIAPEWVSTEQLRAVADQAVQRLNPVLP